MAQTLSRGGAIGLIGGLFFLGFHDWRQSLQKIDRRSFASHYGMVAVILISVFMMSGLLKRTENIHEDRSVSNRVVLWMI